MFYSVLLYYHLPSSFRLLVSDYDGRAAQVDFVLPQLLSVAIAGYYFGS